MRLTVVLFLSLWFALATAAQESDSNGMPGMQMDHEHGARMDHALQPGNFLEEITSHATSGTSAEPGSTSVPMLMTMKGPWMMMFHGNLFAIEEWQSSPRGGGKLFSTSWFMPMAQRELGH